jgi:hypothetical protein
MKKLLGLLVLLSMLVVTGCAGRGSFFEWGDGAAVRATPMPYEVRTVSPCGG